MHERDLQRKILSWLRSTGGWWVKYHVEGRYAQAGVPDLLGCVRGRFVALEVKLPGRRPTPLQQAVGELILLAGGVWQTVSSLDEVRQIVYRIEREDGRNGSGGVGV